MENKEWEDQLRSLLDEYNATDPHSSLGQDANDLNSSPNEPDPSADQLQGWKRIEASLDAADQAFDETIRHKVKHYHPAYDPNSWPVFLNRLADTRYLKTKLVVLKTVEVAIVLLLLLSAFNIERWGKLPFDPQPSNADMLHQQQNIKTQEDNSAIKKQNPASASSIKENKDFTQADQTKNSFNSDISGFSAENIEQNMISNTRESNIAFENNPVHQENLKPASAEYYSSLPMGENVTNTAETSDDRNRTTMQRLNNLSTTEEIPTMTMNGLEFTIEPTLIPEMLPEYNTYTTEPLASVNSQVDLVVSPGVPSFEYIKPASVPYTEFAVLTQVDYNALKMPEDRLYSYGKEIVFPSKGIMSPGFGAGFTIAIGHPVWALETGVIYNAKNFEPDRQLIVGGVFDNGSVEFEAMKMQMISLPVQYRYRFDHQGRFKTYAIAGGGFHVIAQSDVDVQIKNHFPSLAFGANPNNDPSLAAIMKESRRIREHIRDGAPFSTKSFVSVNAGLGFEYMLSEHKAIFLQTVAQYQLPNIAFSNNNGKQLRSVSLQAGIRGPLGK